MEEIALMPSRLDARQHTISFRWRVHNAEHATKSTGRKDALNIANAAKRIGHVTERKGIAEVVGKSVASAWLQMRSWKSRQWRRCLRYHCAHADGRVGRRRQPRAQQEQSYCTLPIADGDSPADNEAWQRASWREWMVWLAHHRNRV